MHSTPPWSVLVSVALDCTDFGDGGTARGFIGWQAPKYLRFLFVFKPHTVKLSLLQPMFEKLVPVGLGHRQNELWERTDFKAKQGSYGLAARGKTGTSLYFIQWIWIRSRQPVAGKPLRTGSHPSLISHQNKETSAQTFQESSANIFHKMEWGHSRRVESTVIKLCSCLPSSHKLSKAAAAMCLNLWYASLVPTPE